MRPMLSFACVVALSGCFALTDTARFEQDDGCDLELRLRNFTPHTDDRFEVLLLRPSADPEVAPSLTARALFEPLEEPTLNLRMPHAVPANDDAARPPYRIDFYGDQDGSGNYTFPGDHSWRLPNACVDGPEVFVHNLDFVNLEAPQVSRALGALRVFLCEAVNGEKIEVRLTGLNLPGPGGAVEQTRAVGLYRGTGRPNGTIELPGLFDDGFDYRVEVYVDANANGAFDAGEKAWSFRFNADAPEAQRECDRDAMIRENMPVSACVDPRLPVRAEFPACVTDRGDLVVTLGPLSQLNDAGELANLHGAGAPNAWLNFDPDDIGPTIE